MIEKGLVVELVKRERRQQSRIGTRKLYSLLKEQWQEAGVWIGRDRLFEVLREEKLLIKPKVSRAKTTWSRHSLPVFINLIKGLEVKEPHQVWMSDITYIRTMEGFMYAALITDKGSRKIVGYHLGDSLESIGCQKALKMAIKQLPEDRHPIHHSDRGCQYCCHEYVKLLRGRGLAISMTQENHCYENSIAERVNGILKQEYEMDATFNTKEQARWAFEQAIYLYNEKRPHLSLNYKIPGRVHNQAA